jgi:hypothetical protein
LPATAAGAASLCSGLVDRFGIDAADVAEHRAVAALGIDVVCGPSLVHLSAPPDLMLDAVLGEAGATASR